jgi:hypothetical protein
MKEIGEQGSSGGIVSDYRLDDRAIWVRSPAGAKDFSSILCVQTGSETDPASCRMGTWGPFPWNKAQPGLTTHPHLVPRSRISRSCTFCPLERLRGLQWDSFNVLALEVSGDQSAEVQLLDAVLLVITSITDL